MPTDGEPQGQTDTDPQGSQDEQQDGTPPPQGDELAKAIAEGRKWEARAKKDAQALADLRKQMGSLLTPEQVQDKDKAANDALALAQANALLASKYRVALQEGLPADLADRLMGDNEDALREDAARLKALLGTPTPPKADGKKGHNAPPPDSKPDANQLLRILAKG